MQTGINLANGTQVTVTFANRTDTFTYQGTFWNCDKQGRNTVAKVVDSAGKLRAEVINGMVLNGGTLTVD